MRTLVTGGAGFIGSHVVRTLVRSGRHVVVADDFSRGRKERIQGLDNVEIHEVDLRDFRDAQGLFRDIRTVFHLAARIGNIQFLHETETAELEALQTNVVIDTNVFRACQTHLVDTIVYASSVSVYPIDKQFDADVVLTEGDISSADPDGGYGWAKLLGEIQLQWMRGPRIGIARIFNIYGEGESPDDSSHVVPALIRKAILHPRVDFRVWGDGRQSRDLLHVDDLVEALVRLECVASTPPVIVNLGSGTAISIRTLAEKIIAISGKSIDPIYESGGLVGPRSRTANITRARHMLDWEPRITIDQGLRRTYTWVEQQIRM